MDSDVVIGFLSWIAVPVALIVTVIALGWIIGLNANRNFKRRMEWQQQLPPPPPGAWQDQYGNWHNPPPPGWPYPPSPPHRPQQPYQGLPPRPTSPDWRYRGPR
jgi:hypothetical protein